jgi:hypothetical protein
VRLRASRQEGREKEGSVDDDKPHGSSAAEQTAALDSSKDNRSVLTRVLGGPLGGGREVRLR